MVPAGAEPAHRLPQFTLGVHEDAARVVVAPAGEVDLATVDRVATALDAAQARDRLLDLRGVTFLDTSALRMVLDQHRGAEQDGRRFALVPGPPTVQRLFEIAGIADRLQWVVDTEPPGGDAPAA